MPINSFGNAEFVTSEPFDWTGSVIRKSINKDIKIAIVFFIFLILLPFSIDYGANCVTVAFVSFTIASVSFTSIERFSI